MPLLQAKNLHHSFGDQPLLDNVDLTLEAGERVCLVGRNGSGKSTLLKILAAEIKVDDGLTLSNLIRQYNISDQEAHLVLVNGHFVNCGEDRDSRKLSEGDTVSIWPPVAGG